MKKRRGDSCVSGEKSEHGGHVRVIIPAPLAHPSRRTCLPPMRSFAEAHFGRVSVVMMARVNCSNAAVSEPERVRVAARH